MKYVPHVAVAVLSAVFACATPTTYERGTYTRPPPAEARPGVGLPRYEPEARPLSPQPNPRPKRLLPPQRGPGIWASDEPDPGNVEPRLFGVPLPVPEASPNPQDKSIAAYCAVGMETAAVASGVPVNVFRLDTGARHCLASKLYRACVETMLSRAESWKASGKAYNADMLKRYRAVVQTALAFMAGACTEAQNNNPALDEWATAIYTSWLRGDAQ